MRYTCILLAACLLLAGSLSPASADLGLSPDVRHSAAPSSIVLELAPPVYGECGDVSINGYVGTDHGSVTRMSWDWGDGLVADSWFPAAHHYASDGAREVAVTAYTDTPETRTVTTTVDISGAQAAGCEMTLRLHPQVVLLRDGTGTQPLRLEIRDGNGRLVSPIGRQATYTSTDPSLVQVSASGEVTGIGFGEAEIQASVEGVARPASARVILGRLRVTPSILLLAASGPVTDSLAIDAWNADGSAVDLGEHTTSFTGGNHVASVDAEGTVTAHMPPASFGDSPYFEARVDGRNANNAGFTRVTTDSLGLTLHSYDGEYASLGVADQVGPYPFGALMASLQAVTVTDNAYRIEQWLTGMTPSRGDTQYFVMDPGFEGDGTVPCGLSGNPVRLGIAVDSLKNCLGGTDWLHWGVIYHEMGHNFMMQEAFFRLVQGMRDGGSYSEGLASMLGIYAIDAMTKDPGAYSLGGAAIENLSRSSIWLTPASARTSFFSELAVYETNPDYANWFTADILDAILVKLHDQYGPAFFYRLLSVFVAAGEWRDLDPATEGQRLAVWVAACGAAARADLLPRFRDTWGFPLDQAYYAQVYPVIERLAALRDPAADAGSDRLAPLGGSVTLDDAYAFDWASYPLTLTWQVTSRPAGSTSLPSTSATLHPSFQPDLLGRYVLSLTAADSLTAGAPDTVTVTACAQAAPQVNISRDGNDVVLSWTDQYAEYRVYERGGEPNFTPEEGDLMGAGASGFRHAGALAGPASSRYYLVKATCGGEAASAHSGVITYRLVP